MVDGATAADAKAKSSAKNETEDSKETAASKDKAAARSKARQESKSGNPAKRSEARKKATYNSAENQAALKPNGRWFVPTMLSVFAIGLLWLIVFYISQGAWPVEAWGNWNLLAGFGIIVVGLGMTTRWR
nr:cell division protein CrgA [Brevibacterium sp. 68QC2CO]